MRLVDDHQAAAGDQPGQLLLAEPRVGQPLGRDQQDVDVVGGEARGDVVPLGHVGAGDLDGPDAGAGGGGHLVAHQREQRAHQQRRAGAPAAQEGGGDEVDRRLAPAGALHDQRPLGALDQRRRRRRPAPRGRPRRAARSARGGRRAPRSVISDGGAAVLMTTTVGSGADRTPTTARSAAGDGGGQSTAMRPGDPAARQPRAHRAGRGTPPTSSTMRTACERAVALGLPAIAFTEHLDFTVWLANDRATDRRPARPAPRAPAADRRRGLLRRADRGAATASRAAHLVRRRDRRAAPVRRQRRRAPARLPGRPRPRLAALAQPRRPPRRRRPAPLRRRRRHHAPLPRRAGRDDRAQRRLPGARARRLPAPLLAGRARTGTWRRTTRRSTGRCSARWPAPAGRSR